MEVEVKVKGLAELEARLVELGAIGTAKLMPRILRKTAAPLRERAAANASSIGRSRSLAASVRTMNARSSDAARFVVIVAPRAKDRVATFVHNAYYNRKRRGVFHGHFLEFGHRIGTSRGRLVRQSRALTEKGLARWAAKRSGGRIKGQESKGFVEARPWFQPAIASASPIFVAVFEGELRHALDRIARRRGRASPDTDGVVPP